MSSTLFKAAVVGAVTAGALFLPMSAAQAATKHHPCDDGPGFSNGAFFGDRAGFFGDDEFGDEDFGILDAGFPFHHRHHHDTVIIVTDHHKKKHHKHHHKPAANDNANANSNGYAKPATAGNGYSKPATANSGYGKPKTRVA